MREKTKRKHTERQTEWTMARRGAHDSGGVRSVTKRGKQGGRDGGRVGRWNARIARKKHSGADGKKKSAQRSQATIRYRREEKKRETDTHTQKNEVRKLNRQAEQREMGIDKKKYREREKERVWRSRPDRPDCNPETPGKSIPLIPCESSWKYRTRAARHVLKSAWPPPSCPAAARSLPQGSPMGCHRATRRATSWPRDPPFPREWPAARRQKKWERTVQAMRPR